ncbi:MAG: extracellular solute-binding protein [Gemmataceae bacterium]|nr:extracellular solute-binding protein [Gemmataceae bacterium]
MQQGTFRNSGSRPGSRFPRQLFPLALLAAAGLVLAGGCNPADDPASAPPPGPFAGAVVRFSCPDPRLAELLTPLARVWAARTGAALEVVAGAAAGTLPAGADVGVVPFAAVGGLADRGELRPIPPALKEPGHPYQWSGVISTFRGESYAGWGGRVFALPVAGAAELVLYRSDRLADPTTRKEFEGKFGRSPGPPTTWEDYADLAAFFADKDKAPSLPALPADPYQLVTFLSRVAACYDRPAGGESTAREAGRRDDAARQEVGGFQFRADDGRPRLDSPTAGFGPAAEWLAGLKARGGLPAGGDPDPVAALTAGRAALAVVSLHDLHRLRAAAGKDLGRYGVAPLPGTRSYIDPATGKRAPAGSNYVPHLAGGWLGVVRADAAHPEAAWDLLAELGGPTRSLELVAAGYGPFRDLHLDRDRMAAWYGYGFDDARTKALQDAVRASVGKGVRNPTFGLRTPDEPALTAALAGELRRVAAGEVPPAEGLKRVTAGWDAADKDIPADKLRDWRRKALGLN